MMVITTGVLRVLNTHDRFTNGDKFSDILLCALSFFGKELYSKMKEFSSLEQPEEQILSLKNSTDEVKIFLTVFFPASVSIYLNFMVRIHTSTTKEKYLLHDGANQHPFEEQF